MELRHLRYFLMVAEELHFGRAAERLAIKQPPLSRQIMNLESELGVRLFDRSHRRVTLTPSGRYLKDAATNLFAQTELIRNTVGLMKEGMAGVVRIGYVGSAMHSILPGLLRELSERYPEIHPEFFELDNDTQIRELTSGLIDIGFVRTPLHAEGLALLAVLEETFSLVLSADHRLAADPDISLDALADEPYVGFCRECAPSLADQILKICNDAGFSPRIVHSTSQLNALLRLVESGFGYSIVPTSVRSGYNLNLRFVELVHVPHRAQLSAIYNPQLLSSTAKTVLDLIEQTPKNSA
ncbi:MAG: LysR family transcriptional regulator [Candidatus Atribacteria bacterium]|nr:MAG: LysR family transcriptional regulator [Candidatus Atribacteria bacterium]